MAADPAPSAPQAHRAPAGRPPPDPDPHHGPGGWRGLVGAVGRRWPTWTALALTALLASDLAELEQPALVLMLAAVGYLAVAVLGRPRLTWLVLGVLVVVVVVAGAAGVDERVSLVTAAGLLLVAGIPRGLLARRDLRAAQAPAVAVFLAVAIGAVAIGPDAAVPDVGAVLLAAGLLAHSAWDVVHLRARAVVSRSLAEWCCVLDGTLGLGLLAVAFT